MDSEKILLIFSYMALEGIILKLHIEISYVLRGKMGKKIRKNCFSLQTMHKSLDKSSAGGQALHMQ